MTGPGTFLQNTRAASAAEFALVLPLFLMLLLGTIDVGRYIWAVNEVEKATQMGARVAVATHLIPGGNSTTGLKNYSFVVSGGLAQGSTVPQSSFPTFTCTGTSAGTVGCACSTCVFSVTPDADSQTAFAGIYARMRAAYGGIRPQDVSLTYSWSGLGYAGDPSGPDAVPVVTVRVSGVRFSPITGLSLANFRLPPSSYSLTNEDGAGLDDNSDGILDAYF